MSEKYPRTPHLPWSPGGTSDDRRLVDADHLINIDIIVTEKLDGSNLCMTRDEVLARSHSSAPTHRSFDLAKSLHAQVRLLIDKGISVFGEYCFAVHSIEYAELPGFFLVFAVRDDSTGVWWSWSLVEMMADTLSLPTVPVLFRGQVTSVAELESLTTELGNEPSAFGIDREGVVVRITDEFQDFQKSVAKWVRSGHVQSETHWMNQVIRRQGSKKI